VRLALLYHQFITRGGLEGYLREFAGQLHSAGHELIMVTSRIDEPMRALAAEVRHIPPALSSRGTLARFAERSAALVPELKADAVLGFGRTWRQHLHRAGGGCHWHYSRMLPWWKRLKPKNQLELALEKKLYTGGGTRHFVVNSAKVKEELAEAYQVPAERVSVLHTAVDTQKWQPAATPEIRQELRKTLGIPDGVPALLFASLDHRRKGLGTLLPALAQIPEVRLWVAGQPLDAWRGELRKYGMESRATGVGRADLLPYYQAADWFVHPTHYDACANTVLQSMACGLPGFISVNDGAVEFVRKKQNGMILGNPANSEQIAAELKWLLGRSEQQRRAMGAAARETVLPLTWAAHLGQWLKLIGNTAGAPA
jgi:UDP-glucose:(heptosyl)LPS alpha-1,3-glucosyltransferase